MSGFESPNYTQTPNDFFEMIPTMEHSEVNVTLVMIRQTFGFHREAFKMGLNKLAKAAGLSRNAAKDGAEAAEKRGTFRRVNPEAQTEAEWELVVDQPVTPSTSDHLPGQPVTTPPSTSDSQVGVKESLKKKEIKQKSKFTMFSDPVIQERKLMALLAERMTAEIGITPDLKDQKWERVVREIVRKEEKGERLETYSKWLRGGNDYNRPKPHQLSMNPRLILNTWAQAFVKLPTVEREIFHAPDEKPKVMSPELLRSRNG